MNIAVKDIIILLILLPLLGLMIFQYWNADLFEYEIISDYTGIIEGEPLIATQYPLLYQLYRYDWVFFVLALLFAIFYTDWKNIKQKLDNKDIDYNY